MAIDPRVHELFCDLHKGDAEACSVIREVRSRASQGDAEASSILDQLETLEHKSQNVFRAGPGQAKVGYHGMPTHHRPGVVFGADRYVDPRTAWIMQQRATAKAAAEAEAAEATASRPPTDEPPPPPPDPPPTTSTLFEVDLRSAPSPEADAVARLPKGALFTVLLNTIRPTPGGPTFVMGAYGSTRGWLPVGSLALPLVVSSEPPPTSSSTQESPQDPNPSSLLPISSASGSRGQAATLSSTADVHEEPDPTSHAIGQVGALDSVTVLQSAPGLGGGPWFLVQAGPLRGWVPSNIVRFSSSTISGVHANLIGRSSRHDLVGRSQYDLVGRSQYDLVGGGPRHDLVGRSQYDLVGRSSRHDLVGRSQYDLVGGRVVVGGKTLSAPEKTELAALINRTFGDTEAIRAPSEPEAAGPYADPTMFRPREHVAIAPAPKWALSRMLDKQISLTQTRQAYEDMQRQAAAEAAAAATVAVGPEPGYGEGELQPQAQQPLQQLLPEGFDRASVGTYEGFRDSVDPTGFLDHDSVVRMWHDFLASKGVPPNLWGAFGP